MAKAETEPVPWWETRKPVIVGESDGQRFTEWYVRLVNGEWQYAKVDRTDGEGEIVSVVVMSGGAVTVTFVYGPDAP